MPINCSSVYASNRIRRHRVNCSFYDTRATRKEKRKSHDAHRAEKISPFSRSRNRFRIVILFLDEQYLRSIIVISVIRFQFRLLWRYDFVRTSSVAALAPSSRTWIPSFQSSLPGCISRRSFRILGSVHRFFGLRLSTSSSDCATRSSYTRRFCLTRARKPRNSHGSNVM